MFHRIIVLFVTLLCIASFTGISFANDSFIFDNGHTVYPINTNKIRMVSEKVTVTIGERDAHVKCEFLFENTTQGEIKAKLGFPSFKSSPEMSEKGPLRNFTSSINGIKANVELKNELRKKYDPVLKESFEYILPWHIWNVVFPPEQRIKIENSYDVTLSFDYYNSWFEYILTTGANWKGPIGHALIEVEYKDRKDLQKRLIKASPANFQVIDNKIVWNLRDFVPRENIKVVNAYYLSPPVISQFLEYLKTKPYEADNRLYRSQDLVITRNDGLWKHLSFHKEYYIGNVGTEEKFVNEIQIIYLRLLRNEIYARHGKTFNSKDLKRYFSSCKWYKKNPNYSDTMLNPQEIQNIKYIVDFEKKSND
jgi:hypothetical protein